MSESEDEGAGASDACGKSRLYEDEDVFLKLMLEVQHAPPGARLSARLRALLERMSPSRRRALATRRLGGCAPLFVAAWRGNTEAVEYLVHVCGAPLEQRGRYAGEAGAAHRVTPLWAAAVAGRLAALRALADAGAELDARSDSGSTPLRSACFMSHLDVARFLCARGADVRARNHAGGTCLINAVQAPRLVRLLLAAGAAPDAQDAHGHTALHYAAREHRADTARALLAAGADPRLRTRAGDDALRVAAARGAAPLVELLAASGRYSAAERADALELLGATQLDELEDAAAALASWERATALRVAAGAPKVLGAAVAALGGAAEWRDARALAALAGDGAALRTQALLVAVRVLGAHHKDTVFRIMYRGAAEADAQQEARCCALWSWALQLRVERDTLLHTDSSHTLCALTRVLAEGRARSPPRVSRDAVLAALRLVARAVPENQRLMAVRPWCAAQAAAWDSALRCLLHLAALALAGAGGEEEEEVARALRPAVEGAAATRAGATLLHLACARLPPPRSPYYAERALPEEGPPAPPAPPPCARTVRVLLALGAALEARDAAGRTPLHVAAAPLHRAPALVDALLAAGAHACSPDAAGAAALPAAAAGGRVSLQCLAARALLAGPRVPPDRALPRPLRAFLALHRYEPEPEPAP